MMIESMTTADVPQPVDPSAVSSRDAAGSARRARWWPWLMAIAIAGAGYYGYTKYEERRAAPPAAAEKTKQRSIPAVTVAARKGDMDVYVSSLGTVTAFNSVTIKSRVGGELVNVAFKEGQMVRAGDLLAEIDPRPYQVQLDQAEGQLARDQATLTSARLDLARQEQLLASRAVTKQQLDAQRALVSQAEGTVKSDQAMVDNARLQLGYCRITAPISGRIGLRRVDQGNLVQANDINGMAMITQLEPIAVMFTVPQDEISRVQAKDRSGQPLTVEAFNRDFQTRLGVGKLDAVDNQVDPATGTVRLKAVFSNDEGRLFPNQFVNVRLLIETRRDAVIVPAAAVQRGPDSSFVYVVNADRKVELRNVIVGPTEGDQSIITTGLSSGEVVVTEGTDKLRPGSLVEPKSAVSPDGKALRQASTAGGSNER
jgi:multidrug efflux system membrane fusion protein